MDLLEFMMELVFELSGSEKHDAIYNRIRYPISGITHISSHYFAKTKVISYDSLPIEKRLILHNDMIHIRPVLNKKNRYFYWIFLEKCSYQLAKKQPQIFVHCIIMFTV